MNSKKILLVIVFIVLSISIVFFGRNIFFREKPIPAPLESIIEEVTYIINKGVEGEINQYQIEIKEDSTVFTLLKELSERKDFDITFKEYDIGVFIESIDGYKNGTDNKYWQYWINNMLGEVAADKKQVKNNDKIEWKFEISQF